MEFFKIFGGFLRQHRAGILLFCLYGGIFYSVFSLYALEAEAVFYAVLLCIAVGSVWGVVRFLRYVRRHRQLQGMKEKIQYGLEGMPAAETLEQRDYTDLLEVVYQEKTRLVSAMDREKTDLSDYYTLWAHQIKTPIAAMHLLLQAEDTEGNKDLSAELFKIEQYVEMALSYLRLGSDTTDFVIRRHDLEPIVRQAVHKYAPLFVRKRIALEISPLPIQVLTDEKWLCFVIEQILSNALKYTAAGKISIYMADADRLVISDTGIGIAPEDLPRVCEKGFTGYNGRTDKKATGLGLYLCKKILQRLSHTITLESEIGKGTKVILNLSSVHLTAE
ncbi:MAG TPA: sensor histidine kinase [Firmicutes bacterium]|nr:sensor histidine kinase [Bacillota bacterium]